MAKKGGGFRAGYRTGEALGAAVGSAVGSFFATITRGVRVTSLQSQKRETHKLYNDVRAAYEASPFASPGAADQFMFEVAAEALERAGHDHRARSATLLGEALFETTRGLLIEEGSLFGFPEVNWSAELGLEQGVTLRRYLLTKRRFLADHERLTDIWREKVIRIYEGLLGYIPETTCADEEDGDESHLTFHASLVDFLVNPSEVVERTVVTMFDNDIVDANLFEDVREHIETNVCLASGIDPEDQGRSKRALLFPTQVRGKSPSELVHLYLRGTPFEEFLTSEVPWSIPSAVRFEHCHIVGGTGHGKTQLLQLLIHADLLKARDGKASVVVIDSQGDLIRTISHLAYFSPSAEKSLAQRFMLIDPNDVSHPVCLNMFDVNMERISSYSVLDREKILNGTIELYEYIFGALLGAELTQKMGVIFRYLARLMLVIPDATVQTLLELMEDGKPFKPYMEKLEGTSKKFFQTQFFHPSFNATKSQILKRLWGVLANQTFERMFSNPENKVDLFEAMNSGKIILINTAKDLLKQDCEIFGRFFIAIIAQAAMERATIPASKRMPTFVYIDEAADYFDQNIENLLNQARKFKVGMTLAHQNLGQLRETGLRASIMASTSIKLAGGVSAKDAAAFSQEMHCEAAFVQTMRKRKDHTEFACWIKNTTPQAIKISVPLGAIDDLPAIEKAEYRSLIEENRKRYCISAADVAKPEVAVEREASPSETSPPISKVVTVPKPERPDEKEPVLEVKEKAAKPVKPPAGEPAPMGRGGRQHRYFQWLVKQAAEDCGFHAVIEKEIDDGSGRVDVSLEREDFKIACEISVTTSSEQELANIRKCLAASYDEVLLVSSKRRHLDTLRKSITAKLEPKQHERVFFLEPEAVLTHLDQIEGGAGTAEKTVRGYRVKSTLKAVSPEEAAVACEPAWNIDPLAGVIGVQY